MTLRDDAIALSRTLNGIVTALEQVEDSIYMRELATFLKPVVSQYDQAVYATRSREQAAAAIDELAECMDKVNAAVTRGEMQLFDDAVLAQYWNLHAIFREARYRHQSL